MVVNLNSFTNVQSTGNRIVMESAGGQERVGSSGGLASWFKSTFTPGKYVQENKGAMRAFIGKISAEKGQGMARVATQMLQQDLNAGLPLTGAKIRSTMAHIQKAEIQRNSEMNLETRNRLCRFDSNDPFSASNKLLADVAGKLGMTDRIGELDMDLLKQKVSARLIGESNKDTRLLSQSRSHNVVKTVIGQQLQGLLNVDRAMEKATELGIPKESPKRTALQDFLKKNPISASEGDRVDQLVEMTSELKVKTDSQVEKIDALLKQSDTFFDKLGGADPGDHVVLGNTTRLLTKIAETAKSLTTSNLGVDDLMGVQEAMIKVQMSPGRVSQSRAEHCFDKLEGEAFSQLMGTASLVYDPETAQKLGDNQSLTLMRLYSLGNGMIKNLGKALKKEEQETDRIIKEQPTIQSTKDVNINTLMALKSVGVNLSSGEIPMSGELTEGFKAELSALLPTLAMSREYDARGMDTQCLKDMNRGTYQVNGKDITRPGGKGAYSVNKGVGALTKAIPDENTRKIISSLAHQGLMATHLQTQLLRNDSPFQAVVTEIHDKNHRMQYNIRTDDSDKIFLDFTYNTNFDKIVCDSGDSSVDPSSHYSIKLTVAIDREMAKQGIPQASIQGTAPYDIGVKF